MRVTFDYDKGRKLGIIKSSSLDTIREHFSEKDETAKIRKKVSGFRYIPERNYCITKGGKYQLGLTFDIIKFIKNSSPYHKIDFTPEFKEVFICGYDFHDQPLKELTKPDKYQERFYQPESIKRGLKIGNGIFLFKTAAGKTYISAQLIGTVRKYQENVKTLIVVPTVQLVKQTFTDFKSYGIDPKDMCKWHGGQKLDTDAPIVIANIGILQSDSSDLSFIEDIGLFILDECHILKKSNKINKVLKHVKTYNRFAFTGTLPDTLIDQWNVIGKIGPVLYQLSRQEMVDNNFISDAEIKNICVHYAEGPEYQDAPEYTESGEEKPKDPLKNYNIENRFIERSSFRNNIIKKICTKLEKNVLIVIERIEHGETLEEILSGIKGKRVFFIRGEVEVDDREKCKQIMEQEDNIICIAISKIFSTGINIKNLHYIIFGSAGKAKIKIIQSIGRGVRLHANKTLLIIFDIADMLRYGKKHLLKREEIYEEEGFKIKRIDIKET